MALPRTSLPAVAVVVVAVLWGLTFTVTAEALTELPPAHLVLLRFGFAAGLLRLLTRGRQSVPPELRVRGLVLGLLLGGGFLLQTWALRLTDAAMSGFLTGLLVVIAPVLDVLLFGRRTGRAVWGAVGVALVGLTVLSVREVGFRDGDVLTVAAAVLWALHLVLLSRWSAPTCAFGLARRQTTTVAGMALVAVGLGAGRNGVTPYAALPVDFWLLVAFLAVLSTAVPMLLLTWAQARVDATRTAVLLTLEPVVAAFTAAASGRPLDARTVAGGALLVVAMAVVALRPSHPQDLPEDRTSGSIPGQRLPVGSSDQRERLSTYSAIPVSSGALAGIPGELSFVEAAPMGCGGVTTSNALRHTGAGAGTRSAGGAVVLAVVEDGPADVDAVGHEAEPDDGRRGGHDPDHEDRGVDEERRGHQAGAGQDRLVAAPFTAPDLVGVQHSLTLPRWSASRP